MKNECSIVRDLLPLYAENMVSQATAAFVREHLDNCPDCRAELAALVKDEPAIPTQAVQDAAALVTIKKKLRKKLTVAVTAAMLCLLTAAVLLQIFPIYRIARVQITNDYTRDQLADLVYIGSPADRSLAQAVLRQADAAFADCRHTQEENRRLYGPLARYATDAERGAAYTEYTLQLWSAHLGETSGTLWVYYSHRAFDANGDVICGSSNIPSYWTVEKNADGEWIVVNVRERA